MSWCVVVYAPCSASSLHGALRGHTRAAVPGDALWRIGKPLPLIEDALNAVAVRCDGKLVVTAGNSGCVRLFAARTARPLMVSKYHRKGTAHPIRC